MMGTKKGLLACAASLLLSICVGTSARATNDCCNSGDWQTGSYHGSVATSYPYAHASTFGQPCETDQACGESNTNFAAFLSGVRSSFQPFDPHCRPSQRSLQRSSQYPSQRRLPVNLNPGYASPYGASHDCGQSGLAGGCGPVAPVAASAFYGGFEFLWMRANFDQNVALIIDPPVGNTAVAFDYAYELSPRAWLGWESCGGSGVRFSFFRFDESADTESVTAIVGATPVFLNVVGAGGNLTRSAQADVGETLTSDHRLRIQAFDVEATQNFRFRSLWARLGGGVRIASLDQYLRADVRTGVGALEETVTKDLRLRGAGPTASLQVFRPVAESRLSLFGSMRGSLLATKTEQKIYEMKGAFTTELEDAATEQEVLTVIEMSLGLQWTQPVGRRTDWFTRAGYELQVWHDVGGPVNSNSTLGLDAITLATGLQF